MELLSLLIGEEDSFTVWLFAQGCCVSVHASTFYKCTDCGKQEQLYSCWLLESIVYEITPLLSNSLPCATINQASCLSSDETKLHGKTLG